MLLLVPPEALTVMTVMISAFWEVVPCSLAEIYRCFGGTHCLHLERS